MCLKYIPFIFVILCACINCDGEDELETSRSVSVSQGILLTRAVFMFNSFKSASNLTERDMCMVDCFKNWSIPGSVRRFLFEVIQDVFKRHNSTNIRRFFNATMLEWYCRYAYGRHQCIFQCNSDSALKTEVLKSLRPTSYICNETDFIAYSNCYRQVYEDDVDQCESKEKCLPYKTATINFFYEGRTSARTMSQSQEIEFILNSLCRYINCGNQCRMNEISTQCGEESNRILIGFYQHALPFFKQITLELYPWSTDNGLLSARDTCEQI